jgi:hypothetical protein
MSPCWWRIVVWLALRIVVWLALRPAVSGWHQAGFDRRVH